MSSHHRNYPLAASLALIAFTGWSLGDAGLKLAREANVPPGEIMMISGAMGMIAVYMISALRGKVSYLRPARWDGLFAIGLCQLVAYVTWLAALPHLPLANMYVVAFLTPMMVACLAHVFLKEHLGMKRAVAIIVGFVGVIIAVNPVHLTSGGSWLPYLIVSGNMVGSAVQMFLLRLVADRERSESTSFYPRLVMIAVGFVWCCVSGFAPVPFPLFLAVATQGILGGLGWALMAQAFKNAPAAAVAPLGYIQIIVGAFLGYIIWNEKPDAYLFSGGAVIVLSGLYLIRHERRMSRMMVRAE